MYSANGAGGGGGLEAGPSVLTVSSFGTTNQGGVMQTPDRGVKSSLDIINNNNSISAPSSIGTALGVPNISSKIDRNSLNAEVRVPVRKSSRQFGKTDANGTYNPGTSQEFGSL